MEGKWERRGIYRIDYIGQQIYELRKDDTYFPVIKTGCVYVKPHHNARVEEDGMICNAYYGRFNPARVRVFDDFIALEPSGIIVPKENITFTDFFPEIEYNRTCTSISERNNDEACEVFYNTFFGNYAALVGKGKRFSKEIFDKVKDEILNNINVEASDDSISPYDYACMFCYYLLKNGSEYLNLDALSKYIYALSKDEDYKKLLTHSRWDFIDQFKSLRYVGIVYPDYESINELMPRPYINYKAYDGEVVCKIFDQYGDMTRDLKIDQSNLVLKILEEKCKQNPKYCVKVEFLVQSFLDFYERIVEQAKKTGEGKIKG